MDVPLAEELELLENAFLDEDCGDEFEEDVPVASSASPVEDCVDGIFQPSTFPVSRKRGLSFESDASPEILSEEKRRRQSSPENDKEEDDPIPFSPLKDQFACTSPIRIDVADDFAPPCELSHVVADERFIWRFASEIEGDCVPVTGPCGERVYAKMSARPRSSGANDLRTEQSGLLSESIHVLLEKVEQEAMIKALQESTAPAVESINLKTSDNEQLWVEKYAPKSFTDLLSHEQTNREVLLWLKQWDSCVFGSHIRATSDDVLSALRRHYPVVQHQKTYDHNKAFGKKPPKDNQFVKHLSTENHEDSSLEWNKHSKASNGTPEHKVLLLCGPPGLGKTTLAHVAARHCGYRVVEINASDDRSSSTIESKILDVVQMNSVMSDARPKCLVIDEIDGALGEGKGAVDVILKMVTADKKHSKDSSSDVEIGKMTSRRRRTAALSRPVICICNDLYAPALRPLRQIAKVHMFVQPAVSRVVNRLKYICRREGFKTSSIALTTLAEYTECDIRSSLNTLQFLNKKKESLNILEVSSQVVGRKDVSRSAFDVWKEVFQKKKSKHQRNSTRGCEVHGDFKLLDSLITNRGDYELTMDGIHENILQLSFHDPLMQKTVGCLDALGISDCLFRYIMRTQKMSLQVYQPLNAIAVNRLIAQVEKPNIEWPKSFHRCRAMLVEKKDSLKSWLHRISPSISRHLSSETFVVDLVSPLLHILSPKTLRPVAVNLLSEKEKEDLVQVVDTMVSYSINYKNQSKPESLALPHHQKYGSSFEAPPAFSLDPPIDELVNFKDHYSGHISLALAIKQIVAHEVEKQRILTGSLQARLAGEDGQRRRHDTAPPGRPSSSSSIPSLSPSSSSLPTGIGKASYANGAPKKAAPRDSHKPPRTTNFFERFQKASRASETPGNGELHRGEPAGRGGDLRWHPLLFKYNEGFTNAVKRPVRLRELLLPPL